MCKTNVWRCLGRMVLRLLATVMLCMVLYALAVVVLGVLPVNRAYQAKGPGIRIFLVTNGVHTSLVLPARSLYVDWTQVFPPAQTKGGTSRPEWDAISIGWGDRAFYLETPTWGDLKASTALRAISGLDRTVMHVEYQGMPQQESDDTIALSLTPDNYQRLVRFIQASMQTDAQGKTQWVVGHGYSQSDAFYEAKGHYSAINTCNEWTREALSSAGVRVPWWSPFDKPLFWQLRP